MSTLDTATSSEYTAPEAPQHPLSSLTGAEIEAVRGIVLGRPDATPTTRFAYVGLEEPSKSLIAQWQAGGPVPERTARVQLLDMATTRSLDMIVSIDAGTVLSQVELDGSDGQLPILDAEFEEVGIIANESAEWVAALAARGLTVADVVLVPLSAGSYGYEDEVGRRILRTFAFRQDYPADHPWAHPVDGLTAYIDVADRRVIRIVDTPGFEIPATSGNYDDPELQGPPLEGLKPIVITQPEGSSFTVDGEHLTWGEWDLRIGFDTREGLVVRQLAFAGRPVMYRGSISEMVVPYADPAPNRFWQNYFDTGEYLFGRYTNELELGCDCVGDITYLDVTIADELGLPRTVRNGVCIHEEDFGTLWKHTDIFTGASEVRRSRRLVISFFTTVGNYDYGFFWYLYLDGTIECEAKLTGILFTSAYPGANDDGSPYPYASEVAPGLGAPYHQHLFSARLDMTVDGTANVVNEIDAVRLPISSANPAGNAFTKRVTPIESEGVSGRVADGAVNRVWQIASTEKSTSMGQPTSYVLFPTETPVLLADPDSSIAARAAFATKNLFVTKYDPAERYAAGDFVNQHPGGAGIPAFIAGDEPLVGEDVVLWHTFGLTHFPRNEDWPVMPMDYAKFTLKPYNFFERSPVLNVPAPQSAHCAPGHHDAHAHGHGPEAGLDDHGSHAHH
ncbi:primary-amine oxidase [Microbacterium sp. cx-55]|uniref:primary-amine oxidase n=1 Tax=Microbacterium sp. cx-55 TaxID=2875948 RepID=UPI001CBEA6DD|nr:primary-amine oxidase [Microbacterium sp. cx-55]MBZ4486607.1 primary-amine oxidase [Microbacterium sp. cx-55]UGB36426.1 primary-amine oxidase [Microbacterium sp. cx-55]